MLFAPAVYLRHSWLRPSGSSGEDARDGVARILARAFRGWMRDGHCSVDGDALDDVIQQFGRLRVEKRRHGGQDSSGPFRHDVPESRLSGCNGIELQVDDHVPVSAQQIVGDGLRNRLAGVIAGARLFHAYAEPFGRLLCVMGERLEDQVVESVEMVGHRPERHIGRLGDDAVRGPRHAALGDDIKACVDDALSAVRVDASRAPDGRGRIAARCGSRCLIVVCRRVLTLHKYNRTQPVMYERTYCGRQSGRTWQLIGVKG